MKKNTDNPDQDLKSPEATVNEIMETITSIENNTNSKGSTQESTNEEDLLNLFKQYSDFCWPTSGWLGADATILTTNNSTVGYKGKYISYFPKI